MNKSIIEQSTLLDIPFCACDCGQTVRINRDGKPNKYIHGHHQRGIPKSAEHRKKLSIARLGKPGIWLNKKMSADARSKMSAAKKGKSLTPEHRAKIAETMTGKPHPSIHHKQSLETKQKKSIALRGEKSSAWKGGISQINDRIRASFKFREWRIAVFQRDHYTCQKCGSKHQKGSRPILNVHHIKPFAQYPELRFNIENGLTLCKKCHDKIHGLEKGSGRAIIGT